MKRVLLVGSSIFEQWSDLTEIAPGVPVINRAVGGTITADWTQCLAGLLEAESPDAVLLYCGSNDINAGVAEDEIVANVMHCRRIVADQLPQPAFANFSIIKAPQKLGKWDTIDRLNEAIRHGLPVGDLYVESNDVFVNDDLPVERFYLEDGLHLTQEAYDTLATYARPLVADWLNKRSPAASPSRLVVGGHSFIAELGNDAPLNFDGQLAIVNECLDRGINCFDTTYEPERVALGRILDTLGRRDEAEIIAWNFFTDPQSGDYLGPPLPFMADMIDLLLEQLRTDYIDRVVVHPVENKAADHAQLEVAQGWVEAGQVGLLGTWAPGDDPAAHFGTQNPYDFMVASHNLDGPNAASFRAGKAIGWRTFATSPFNRGWLLDRLVAAGVEKTSESPDRLRPRIADALLRFALNDPNLDHLIVGIRQSAWIQANLESVARGPLSEAEMEWLCGLGKG